MSAHEAGRELDALIAERVMGWTWKRNLTQRSGGVGYEPGSRVLTAANDFDCGMLTVARGREPISEGLMRSIPHYSADIAAAEQVLKRLRAQEYQVVLSDQDGGGWQCCLWNGQLESDFTDADGDTIALAICRAALAAIEVPA